MNDGAYHIGMVGLGTMGRNLLLNMADRGYAVAGYDKNAASVGALLQESGSRAIGATSRLAEFVQMLRSPRAVMMLVPAGPVVDSVIGDLLPHLRRGDLLIDGGNSFFKDTDLRGQMLAGHGIHFMGVGVSGGEHGARHGPSLMPGGPPEAYERVRPLFEAVAASVGGDPCVAYMGPGSAGHYVKMVHNGIEYGLMQLIAEAYDLMKRGLGMGEDDLHEVFARWNTGELAGYLIEITADIFLKVDDRTGKRLVNIILDAAKQKGTGMWTSQNAMDLHVPLPTTDMAVAMRDLSSLEAERTAMSRRLAGPVPTVHDDRGSFTTTLGSALYASMLLAYAQGMALLSRASAAYGYGVSLEAVARIWRGGCIIRSASLEKIRAAYLARPDLATLLLDPSLASEVADRSGALRAIVSTGAACGIPVPAFAASLAYFDGYRSAWLPANLIQAQRDYFGAHTYERIDEKGVFHTEWSRE